MKFSAALFALSIQGMRIMKRSFLEDFYMKNFLNNQVMKKGRSKTIHKKKLRIPQDWSSTKEVIRPPTIQKTEKKNSKNFLTMLRFNKPDNALSPSFVQKNLLNYWIFSWSDPESDHGVIQLEPRNDKHNELTCLVFLSSRVRSLEFERVNIHVTFFQDSFLWLLRKKNKEEGGFPKIF